MPKKKEDIAIEEKKPFVEEIVEKPINEEEVVQPEIPQPVVIIDGADTRK